MRAIPIPDGMAEDLGGHRVVFGLEELEAGVPVNPIEAVVAPSNLYPGVERVHSLIELDDTDRAALASGARLLLTIHRGMAWQLNIVATE